MKGKSKSEKPEQKSDEFYQRTLLDILMLMDSRIQDMKNNNKWEFTENDKER